MLQARLNLLLDPLSLRKLFISIYSPMIWSSIILVPMLDENWYIFVSLTQTQMFHRKEKSTESDNSSNLLPLFKSALQSLDASAGESSYKQSFAASTQTFYLLVHYLCDDGSLFLNVLQRLHCHGVLDYLSQFVLLKCVNLLPAQHFYSISDNSAKGGCWHYNFGAFEERACFGTQEYI